MKILVEFYGSWGLGDKILAGPLFYHLKRIYGQDTTIHTSGDSGIYAHNPFWGGKREDTQYDKTISINCFDRMPIEKYQELEAMPTAIGHMLSYAGINYTKVERVAPNLYLSEDEKKSAFNKFLRQFFPEEPKNLIAMCIDYYDPRRHLSVRKWNKIASILRKKGYTIINLGLQNHLKKADIDLVGKTTVREAGSILSYCSLFIGNNSGLFHIAQSVRVPCVCTFSLAIPERFIHGMSPVYPVQTDIKCKNCITFKMLRIIKKKSHCLRSWVNFCRCMKAITVEMIMRKIEGALNDKENSYNLR